MNTYPSNNKVASGYHINLQFEGGTDGFNKVQDDSNITCCFCLPAVCGFKTLTVLLGLEMLSLLGGNVTAATSVVSFVLMLLWMLNDNKKTRWYLYISQVIQLVVVILATLAVSVMLVIGASYASANAPDTVEFDNGQGQTASLDPMALIAGYGIFIAIFLALAIGVQYHYVSVAKKLWLNIEA